MRKKITLISAVSCCLCFLAYTVMLLQQSLLVDNARQEFYDQKIIKQQHQLQHNLDILNKEVREISRPSAITGVFVQKSISLEQFPNALKNGVRSIRFTDSLGKVIYSSHETQEFNRQISHKILEWFKNNKGENAFFFVDRDHIISIQRYQNPYLMGESGYIIVEFSSSQLFYKLRIPHYFVRIIGNQPATLVLSDTKNINMELASILALKKDNIPPRNGMTISVPMLGQVVYYMGEDFYLPPIMTGVSVILLLLGLMLLRLYSSEPKIKEEYDSKITQLIQDIEDGNNYNEMKASKVISNASNFGFIKDLDIDDIEDLIEEIEDEEIEEELEEIDELSDFSDIAIEDEEIEEELEEEIEEEFEDIDELSDFSDIAIEDEEIEEELEEEIEEEFEYIDELSDFSDIAIEDEEIEEELEEEIEEEFEDIDELSDFSDIAIEDEEIDDKIIDTDEENDDTLQQVIPLEDIDNVEESYIPQYALGNYKNEAVQKYMDDLSNILEQYNITNYAVAEEDDNIYIFNGESFGAQFIIDKEDGLYQEVLSKGNALSLSGDLMDSVYLENLFSREFLSEFTELYIRPVMENGNVKGVVILARDGEELSQDERRELLKNH